MLHGASNYQANAPAYAGRAWAERVRHACRCLPAPRIASEEPWPTDRTRRSTANSGMRSNACMPTRSTLVFPRMRDTNSGLPAARALRGPTRHAQHRSSNRLSGSRRTIPCRRDLKAPAPDAPSSAHAAKFASQLGRTTVAALPGVFVT